RSQPQPVLKVAAGPALAQTLRTEPGLDVIALAPEAAATALRTGTVALAAEMGERGALVLSYDDTNPEGRAARTMVDRAVQRAAGRVDPVTTTDRLTREPGARYVDFLVPGLVGLGIMSNAVWGLGFSIVDSRRRKLTKRLIATPMSKVLSLGSYLVWRLLILWFEVGLPIGFGWLVFGVPVRGTLIEMAVLVVFASMSFSTLGLLIATRARTIEAV